LADALRDDTGVIFASAFPGFNSFAEENSRYYTDRARREQLATLYEIQAETANEAGQSGFSKAISDRIEHLEQQLHDHPYIFERRFLLRTLPMGHSQFAELIGARGPNTHLNAACASTTQAVAVAEDWINAGRCRRVVIISADDVTSDSMMGWFGAGFLASGAAATDEDVAEAAIPFDRRRHGLIVGMGAAALVVESAEAARERGIQPICEVLSAVTANSAFHGTRLDIEHIRKVMESLVRRAEEQHGISRSEIAPRTVFVSHETYTPARGGSASAEINSLRSVFGEVAGQIVIANTKGYTGHAMATGIEDVLAVKSLETGLVPPVANFKEVDPELGRLNLSRGGSYPVEFALRLGAGFGSQISMALLHWTPMKDKSRRSPDALGYQSRIADDTTWSHWIREISGKSAPELIVDHRTLRVRDGIAVDTTVTTSKVKDSKLAPSTPEPPTTTAPPPTLSTVAKQETHGSFSAAPNIKDRVLSLVAEKTGYPVDMLDLDLDLEADLGVDTVKQAEVFAAVREQYGIARDDKVRLRDFPTLAHVIRFVEERIAFHQEVPPAVPEQRSENTPSLPVTDDVKARVLGLVAEKTGYPVEMLDLDLDLEADLGVDTVKQAEVFAAIREIYTIPRDPNLKLRDFPTLAHVIRFVNDRRPQNTSPRQATLPSIETDETAAVETKAPVQRDESVHDRILALVVEKTGYPREMLDLDLDLEADLGVDTVKQAELFASMRAIYGIERDQNLKLRDFPTLKHVINFVYQKRPDLAVMAEPVAAATAYSQDFAPEPEPPVTLEQPQTITGDDVAKIILTIASEKTGYPVDMLALDLDLEADLGVDTVKQAEMFASVRQAFNIPRIQDLKLRDFPTLGHVIDFAKSRAQQTTVVTKLVTSEATKPSQTAIFHKSGGFEEANKIPRRIPVPSLRPSLSLCKLTGVNLDSNSRVVIMPDKAGVAKELETLLRAHGVSVLMLDRSADPLPKLKHWLQQAQVQGVYWLPGLDDHADLSKMSPDDWQEEIRLRVKSLYCCMKTLYESVTPKGTFLVSATALGGQNGYDEAGATAPIGGAVAGFTKAYQRERPEATVKTVDFGTTESSHQIAMHLLDETLRDPGAVEVGYKFGARWAVTLAEQPAAETSISIDEHTVFVVTGAAGSIVSAITADLAAASGGTFYLLDLVPEPDATNTDLRRLNTDRDSLKRDLFKRIQDRGERATPALVEKEFAQLERARAALDAIQAVNDAGGKAYYRSLDLRDSAAVSKVIEKVREAHGRIDVLIHAAGMERSHFLPDKQSGEFDLVFDVKATGVFNLLHAIGDMPLGATVVFSSIAGRFGNGGQTDYSAANDLLCKLTSSLRRTHPATQAIAIDWTAWKDIGMASRGSIPKMMELAGIDMISPEAGVPIVRREITSGFRGEVVIAERLGILLKDPDPDGGLDTNQVATHLSKLGPMVASFSGKPMNGELELETLLDPAVQPFLFDHRIEGTAVLPGVMGVETFAEVALSLLPEWRIDSIDNIDFSSPFKFYRNEPRRITTNARFTMNHGRLQVACSLDGKRTLPGNLESRTAHFTGRVLLADSPSRQNPPRRKTVAPVEPVVDAKNIYQIYFHGPAYQVIEKAWRDGDKMVGKMSAALPPNHIPADLPTVWDPRVLELCLQTAGLWELTIHSRLGLPLHIDQVKVWRTQVEPGVALHAVVTPDERHGLFNVEVIDSSGDLYCELLGYRTVTFLEEVDASPLRWLQAVAA
ncbi:MAG TPA: SDR family NAD(P)-dependent oxidoreductase, partial [Terriglobales bacterium]|nr:SDR family NAD(P)-dependent oxidoreductase [Terriglobales bacterium]